MPRDFRSAVLIAIVLIPDIVALVHQGSLSRIAAGICTGVVRQGVAPITGICHAGLSNFRRILLRLVWPRGRHGLGVNCDLNCSLKRLVHAVFHLNGNIVGARIGDISPIDGRIVAAVLHHRRLFFIVFRPSKGNLGMGKNTAQANGGLRRTIWVFRCAVKRKLLWSNDDILHGHLSHRIVAGDGTGTHRTSGCQCVPGRREQIVLSGHQLVRIVFIGKRDAHQILTLVANIVLLRRRCCPVVLCPAL